ncbi:hypothetical protein JW992_08315 [candidate division KSB1 bacterium]|nr:hypothetical protein [candidate division KSB1 bacterium]
MHRFIPVLCALLFVSGTSQTEPKSQYAQDYRQRCELILDWADSTDQSNFLVAAARIVHGPNRQTGIEMFHRLTEDYQGTPMGMFQFYRLMIGYCAARPWLPNETHNGVKELIRSGNFYRGDTENHLTLYYTALYLAAQAFPNLPGHEWYTGKSSEENRWEAEGWFENWIELTTTIGQGEFDSPTYMAVFLSGLIGLHQFCEDPVLKEKIHGMLLWLIADYSVEHLQGVYAGAHSREYPDRLLIKRHPASEMNYWAWLFFAQTEEPLFNSIFLPAALSDFVPPDILHRIGTERDKPYTHNETKRVRHILRLGKERNPRVYKTTYMCKDFALGSMMGGAVLQPIQQHTWDVSFVGSSPYGTLFTVHPFVGEEDMGMFFPEEMKFATDQVIKAHTYYADPGKWASSSPYEKTFQHRNSIIVLYDLPPGVRYPHIDGFFPRDLEARHEDESGWIFCRSDQTFIAFYPLKPYRWIKEEHGWRMRSESLQNGCVVQVEQAGSFPSFDAFKETLRHTTLVHDTFDETGLISYSTPAGDVMTFAFDGDRLLNGQPIDFSEHGFFKGPFLNGEPGSRRLEIRHNDDCLILDFNGQGAIVQQMEQE